MRTDTPANGTTLARHRLPKWGCDILRAMTAMGCRQGQCERADRALTAPHGPWPHAHAHRRIAADLSNEWHQGSPHSDQTKSHSANSEISAHGLSPFDPQDGDCARIAL